MPTYTVIYGGRRSIEAESMEEAYEQFWTWVIEKARHGEFGYVVDRNEDYICTICGSEDPQHRHALKDGRFHAI